MKEPKFKVGDVLMSVVDDTSLTKLHVVEVTTQLCVAGIEQIFYICRVYVKHYINSSPSISRDLFRFNEMEVELWKELDT